MTISVNPNPNASRFTTTSYPQSVSEIADFGTLMYTLLAADADNNTIEYYVKSSTLAICASYFNLHPNTAAFSTSGDLYHTRPNTNCQFEFGARDVVTPSQESSNTATGIITFIRNEFSPQFPSPEYNITIDETRTPSMVFDVNATDGDSPGTPIGLTIYSQISALDFDEGINKKIYEFIRSPEAQFDGTTKFTFVSLQEGHVIVAGPVDYGNQAEIYYNLTIIAQDGENPQRSNNTTFIIHITDNDDQPPEFVYPSCISVTEQYRSQCIRPKYYTSVPSDSTMQSTLVFTSDATVMNNSSRTVDIIMQDRDTFNSTIAGAIVNTRQAGYESYFSVSTSFAGGKAYQCRVIFNAGNSLNYSVVPELDIILEVTDLDNSSLDFSYRPTYSYQTLPDFRLSTGAFAPTSPWLNRFTLKDQMPVAGTLDRELVAVYNVTASVRAQGYHAATTEVMVRLIDDNFTQSSYNFSTEEHKLPQPTLIGSPILATDNVLTQGLSTVLPQDWTSKNSLTGQLSSTRDFEENVHCSSYTTVTIHVTQN